MHGENDGDGAVPDYLTGIRLHDAEADHRASERAMAAFIHARVREDEVAALAAWDAWPGVQHPDDCTRTHADRWNPNRVLANVKAKRSMIRVALVDGELCAVLLWRSAQEWADHPDFPVEAAIAAHAEARRFGMTE